MTRTATTTPGGTGIDTGWDTVSYGSHARAVDGQTADDSFQDFWHGEPARHELTEDEPLRNRHDRTDLDDRGSYGRHSSRDD